MTLFSVCFTGLCLAQTNGQQDALLKASMIGDVTAIPRLVASGAHPTSGMLWQAIKNNDLATINALLAAGANPNEDMCGVLKLSFDSPLPIIQALLKAGADTNCVWADPSGAGDQTKTPPLMAASAVKGLREAAVRMKQRGLLDGPLPPKDAAKPADIIRLLLKHGVDPNAVTASGETALYEAIDSDDYDVAAALIDGGLDVNKQLPDPTRDQWAAAYERGQTALIHAITRYGPPSQSGYRMIELLLSKGADPNVRNGGRYTCDGSRACSLAGETALTYAAAAGAMSYVELLLRYGADPMRAREDGALPQDIASKEGHAKTASLIGKHQRR